jgi:hypothetical protein
MPNDVKALAYTVPYKTQRRAAKQDHGATATFEPRKTQNDQAGMV